MIGLSTKLQSAWRSTLEGHFQSLSVMSSSRMMQSTLTRKIRRGRLWQLHPVVLCQSTGRCTPMAPPTHIISRSITSTSISSSGLPTHLSTHISGQHLRLYLHLRLCHRPLEPPPATPASIVVSRATSHDSAPRRRRMSLRATSLIHHVVRRRWPLQRLAASTTPPWRIFPRAIKSSWVRFL
jgi:hypothetical protein